MAKTQTFINKPAYLCLSILELTEIVTYEFWYDYVKQKYGEKAKLCYMDTYSFIFYIKLMIFIKILQDVEIRFETSNYELDKLLPKEKNKKMIGIMEDELDGFYWIKSKNL